jgi:hypothetical protein
MHSVSVFLQHSVSPAASSVGAIDFRQDVFGIAITPLRGAGAVYFVLAAELYASQVTNRTHCLTNQGNHYAPLFRSAPRRHTVLLMIKE